MESETVVGNLRSSIRTRLVVQLWDLGKMVRSGMGKGRKGRFKKCIILWFCFGILFVVLCSCWSFSVHVAFLLLLLKDNSGSGLSFSFPRFESTREDRLGREDMRRSEVARLLAARA